MNRDVRKQAEKGRAIMNDSRDLELNELRQLLNIANDSLTTAIATAYYMGFNQ